MFLGVEPEAAGWKAQTNPLSYGGTHMIYRVKMVTQCDLDRGGLQIIKEALNKFFSIERGEKSFIVDSHRRNPKLRKQ